MSYLLDKKIKRNNLKKIIFLVVIVLILIYFRSGVFSGLSGGAQTVFRPVITLGRGIVEKSQGIGGYFYFKKSLVVENDNLKTQLREMQAKMSNYDALLADDAAIKAAYGRKNQNENLTLAGILAKPNQSPYDILLIDAGTNQGVVIGDIVFALGNVPIGRVDTIYSNSAKVVLFSDPGEKTDVSVTVGLEKNISMQLVGRGGGNFEMTLMRDFNLPAGTEVVLPGVNPYVVAVVKTIISDPRDPFQKALLVGPVNIQELKFVQVQK